MTAYLLSITMSHFKLKLLSIHGFIDILVSVNILHMGHIPHHSVSSFPDLKKKIHLNMCYFIGINEHRGFLKENILISLEIKVDS